MYQHELKSYSQSSQFEFIYEYRTTHQTRQKLRKRMNQHRFDNKNPQLRFL